MRIPYMLIGGWALPAYGRIRATLDLDLAVAAEFPRISKLHERLTLLGYQLPSRPHEEAQVFVVTDLDNMVEMEIRTRPDGIAFDSELLRRRVKIRLGQDFGVFTIGPEDFIVNKLARRDRGVQDEQDVISVLVRQKGNLDYDYLHKRAKSAKVYAILKTITDEVP